MPVNQTFSGPFVPEPYDNSAFVTRLADLINRRADVAAQGALQRGASRAQMWQSAGQAVMQTLAQLAQQRELTKQRAVAAEQQAVENAFKNRQIAVQEAAERNAAARAAADEQWRRSQWEWQQDRAAKQDRNEAAQVVVSGMGPGDELSMAAFNDRIKGTPYAEGFSVRPAAPATEGYGVLLPEYSPNARPAQPEAMQYAGTFAQLDKLADNEMEKARLRATIQDREIDNKRADEQAEAMRVFRDDANELRRQTLELQRERIAEQRGNSPYTQTQQRRIDALSRQFDNQPAVKTVQTMAEALSFVEGLNPKTSRSTDDQALIYAFAKVMDPESVVREGEYATVQRYAQSWAQQLGFDARRIFDNSPFLSEEARANIKNTIRSRFASRKSMYDTVRSETIRKINRITGNEDGADELIDYLPTYLPTPSASAMIEAIDPSGNIHHAPAGTPLPPGWRLKQ